MINSLSEVKQIFHCPLAIFFCKLFLEDFKKADEHLRIAFYLNPNFLNDDIKYLKVNKLPITKNRYIIDEKQEKSKGIELFQKINLQIENYIENTENSENDCLVAKILVDLICNQPIMNKIIKLSNKDKWIFEIFMSAQKKHFDWFSMKILNQQETSNSNRRIRSNLILNDQKFLNKTKQFKFISQNSSQIIGNLSQFLPLKTMKYDSKNIENAFNG